ncbi:hypothetical protein A3C59_04365 [Candidatus Daviesbacteria bacterium RIFCSPHIGHO2_02_FULL_36_13]|uniref:PrgI family protein n=1 Tax=Candidatus Daviesbacteria bacterium RIFCSPHIGHO2_02_FULL_36_13 TaxID=1797768 RepID=A0A1F5JW47_9BACT|nr:MAG: hypothetical protein A3C59_04365 [Candidatus Daviesbacteria bacterium RIFCSPHIGHO2_02_FULL_36_13]OGE40906.1 MAG: hypothetical protein A3A45_01145 [Candidatus Daviesbacteria bacterium RIFCSPLOWO2_01_FULL_36_8]
MRTTIVPAQITTVEDKIVANLNMTQIVLIASALFIGVAIFAVLPEKLQFNLYKIPLITFTTLSCFTLSFRIKGRVLLNWILLLSGYFIRPKLYVFDKNDSYLRDIVYLPEIQLIKKKTIQEEKATIKAKTADGVISDFGQLEKILALHRGKLDLKFGKGGTVDAIWPVKN